MTFDSEKTRMMGLSARQNIFDDNFNRFDTKSDHDRLVGRWPSS